jgi:hypothetical protein
MEIDMARRTRSTDPYEITVKTGYSEFVHPDGSKGFGWDSIKTYDRFGRWDADMKADEERRKNPDAVVTVKKVSQ